MLDTDKEIWAEGLQMETFTRFISPGNSRSPSQWVLSMIQRPPEWVISGVNAPQTKYREKSSNYFASRIIKPQREHVGIVLAMEGVTTAFSRTFQILKC